MTYAKRLQKALNASGKTRKELASAIDATVQAVGMILTSAGGVDRSLSAENSAKAARFLRVDGHWLATGEGDMTPNPADARRAANLTDDAIEIAVYFDMLTNKTDRTKAYVAAMAAILKVQAERAAIASAANGEPNQAESPKK